MKKIALMGAGGKMGCRITDNLKGKPGFEIAYVEVGKEGIERLRAKGVTTTPQDQAVAEADYVILAVPDRLIGKISGDIVPKLKSGCKVIGLDPAAAYAGVLPPRKDVTYFVTHPCHPHMFNDETDPKAQRDWFGGIAKQDIVCALYQGPDADYAECEELAKIMYMPVAKSFRITVEQMAILEPAVVETLGLCLVGALKEAYDEAVRMGVPAEAAGSFVLGHARIEFAILFGYADFQVSDGAKLAMEKARDLIFKPDWKKNVMDIARVRESVADITGSLNK